MDIVPHLQVEVKIVEIVADEFIILSTEDGLNLLGDMYYQGYDAIILHAKNLSPSFFDLSNGMAGEILQKFSNYRMRLTIVGDFTSYSSKSLTDFMRESNQLRHVSFMGSLEDAVSILSS